MFDQSSHREMLDYVTEINVPQNLLVEQKVSHVDISHK